jgi:hypothetical protein
MFIVDYVYVPLSGKAYVASDICDSLEVEENGDHMKLEFVHSAKNIDREIVKFTSFVIIPRQRIRVDKVNN